MVVMESPEDAWVKVVQELRPHGELMISLLIISSSRILPSDAFRITEIGSSFVPSDTREICRIQTL